MALPPKSQVEKTDEKILSLHSQGLNYRQISEEIGIAYDYCKLVAYRQLRKENANTTDK
jgi:intein-encoded DNA endonuclease-like protein